MEAEKARNENPPKFVCLDQRAIEILGCDIETAKKVDEILVRTSDGTATFDDYRFLMKRFPNVEIPKRMKTLNDKKFENYGKLREIFTEAVDEVLKGAKSYSAIRGMWKQSIRDWDSIDFAFSSALSVEPELGAIDPNRFLFLMIAPESDNNEDPIYNRLWIGTIGDLFWAKRIVNNAFYELISDRD